MNNSHVRATIGTVIGDTFSSYSLKISATLLYRFETKSSEETVNLLEAIDTHRRVYPTEVVYIQIYGIDGYENTGAVIIIGTKGVPTNSPLFASEFNLSVERA
ncbi:hypothetical protein COY48_03155 [Candidatus Collierbacteria bacterium CG_4_10_14_0_8_um_filter_43_86]|uniref:Uncharacterized protein n=1 Tax=Candidatus Collierbacteria bacterium CG22_combo_CG10-13_8_21_14_all_43_12 TaxID=1974537 RepID=A0A2H0DUW0_9BACT|nr:MAG: hypothetical protein COW83_04630 [Candidatus Collierbacteria bacterium CG22_combo_CG10-13_8_21_14_all_43_12]PIZ24412.1 MAG: hypothetical protein COY48_03155 [Candidatus Collierbacteria bacterium CG_4_10_14_0_8_um_filter_43_86]